MVLPGVELPRRIGAWTAGCVLVSNVIGAGIFTAAGFLARDLGDPNLILMTWLMGGLAALAGALSYSELGAALPVAGGDYVYLRRAYGPLVGFLGGWTSLTVGFSAGIAAGAASFSSYFLEILPETAQGYWANKIVALVLLWLLTMVHLFGTERAGWLQRSLTGLNLSAILLLLLGAFTIGSGTWDHLRVPESRPLPAFGAMVISFVFVSYAYSGWNAATYIAGEIIEPGRSLPRALMCGTLAVMVLYAGLNMMYFFALSIERMAEPPVLPVAQKAAIALFGPSSGAAISAILCLTMASAVSAMVWAGPRVYFAMAADGLLPELFAGTSRTTGVPNAAILLQSAWSSVLILSGTFERLVIYSGVVLAIFNALTVGAVIVLRWQAPSLARPYRVPLYPWVPMFSIALAALVVVYSLIERPIPSGLGILTILAGIPLYRLWTGRYRAPSRP